APGWCPRLKWMPASVYPRLLRAAGFVDRRWATDKRPSAAWQMWSGLIYDHVSADMEIVVSDRYAGGIANQLAHCQRCRIDFDQLYGGARVWHASSVALPPRTRRRSVSHTTATSATTPFGRQSSRTSRRSLPGLRRNARTFCF